MKYVGSKRLHARGILSVMLPYREEGQAFVEPFVGGANMTAKVTGRRIGGDTHPHLIAYLQETAKGWNPPAADVVTEELYNRCREASKNEAHPPSALIGYMGFAMSYGGKWFGGFRRGGKAGAKNSNYVRESEGTHIKQAKHLAGVEFHCSSYDALEIPTNSMIYCDPPYRDTLGYSTGEFDHDKFWQWVRDMDAAGHTIFVSEYSAPEDFWCVWKKEVNNTLVSDSGAKQGTERLWRLRRDDKAAF